LKSRFRFFKALSAQSITKKAKLITWLINVILRHTLVYFLIGCTSAEPISAFASNAKLKKIVNTIQDLNKIVNLYQDLSINL